ncbi:MAG: PD-(D/E)XK nuclease family transposase, partial [Alphaproteobacteria bacterium]
FFKDLELHTIELNKFSNNVRADLADIVAKVKNSLDMWVAFLSRHDLLNRDNLPAELDNPALKKALDVLEVMNFNSEERELYEGHLKWLMIEASTIKKYENDRREEFLEEGRAEEKKNMARIMLQEQMDIQKISRITGLAVEEIKNI